MSAVPGHSGPASVRGNGHPPAAIDGTGCSARPSRASVSSLGQPRSGRQTASRSMPRLCRPYWPYSTPQPALASARAEARPMPLPDPVTSATLPCSDGTTDEEQRRRSWRMDIARGGDSKWSGRRPTVLFLRIHWRVACCFSSLLINPPGHRPSTPFGPTDNLAHRVHEAPLRTVRYHCRELLLPGRRRRSVAPEGAPNAACGAVSHASGGGRTVRGRPDEACGGGWPSCQAEGVPAVRRHASNPVPLPPPGHLLGPSRAPPTVPRAGALWPSAAQ